MKNKIISLALCVVILIGFFSFGFTGIQAEASIVAGDKSTADLGNGIYKSGDYIYKADLPTEVDSSGYHIFGNIDRYLPSNKIVITGYTGSARRLVIPSKIDGYTVGRIGAQAFTPTQTCHTENLTYVKVPSSVYMICGFAFKNCTELSKVVLSEGVEYLCESIFFNCSKLTSIKLPSTIIGLFLAFNGSVIEEITVPAAQDPEHDFLEFAEGDLDSISFLLGYSNIQKAVINKNNVAFTTMCLPKKEIVFNGTVLPMDCYIGTWEPRIVKAVFKKGLPLDYNYEKAFTKGRNEFTKHIDADGGVWFDRASPDESLRSGDYEYILNSKSQAITTSYTGSDSEVTIPAYLDGHIVVKIGDDTFRDNTIITSVIIPETVTEIGTLAFCGCKNLSGMNLPTGITEIGMGAFSGCSLLSEVTLPESIEYLGDYAFEGCAVTSITIPESISALGNSLFKNCSSLTDIDISGSIEYIGCNCFYSCGLLTSFDFSCNPKFINDGAFAFSGIGNADISGLKRIGLGVFHMSSLQRVNLSGDELTLFESFNSATRLKEAVIGNGVTAIYKDSFCQCSNLEKVTIGKDVKYIANTAFSGCSNLNTLYYNAEDCSTTFSLKNEQIKSEPDPESQIYKTLSPFSNHPLDSLIIGNTVKTIGPGFFSKQDNIETVVLPRSVHTIRTLAFFDCSDLTAVVWQSPIKRVETGAFWGCNKLVNFNFKNLVCANLRAFSTTSIETAALGNNDNTAEESFSTISEESFEKNDSLKSVGIGGSVNEIESKAFADCENLETAIISDSVTEIADDAFENCDNLTIYCAENSYAHNYAKANGIRVTTLVIDPIPNQVYTGNPIKPDLTVRCSNKKLEKNLDFDAAYSNNINAGNADVFVTGKGEFEMFASKANFTILTKSITGASVSPISDQNYTGKEIRPEIKVRLNGKTLNSGTDYKIAYYDNVAIGTATVIITGKGNYSGSVAEYFEIKTMSVSEVLRNRLIEFIRNIFFNLFSVLVKNRES